MPGTPFQDHFSPPRNAIQPDSSAGNRIDRVDASRDRGDGRGQTDVLLQVCNSLKHELEERETNFAGESYEERFRQMTAATTRKHKRSNFRATFGVPLSFCHATDCSSSRHGAVSSFRLLDSEEMATLFDIMPA